MPRFSLRYLYVSLLLFRRSKCSFLAAGRIRKGPAPVSLSLVYAKLNSPALSSSTLKCPNTTSTRPRASSSSVDRRCVRRMQPTAYNGMSHHAKDRCTAGTRLHAVTSAHPLRASLVGVPSSIDFIASSASSFPRECFSVCSHTTNPSAYSM